MTVPLSDARLTEIRAAQRRRSNSGQWLTTEHGHVGALLAEVDRLRTLVADLERTVTYFDEQSKRRKTERDQARADLAEAREIASLASVLEIPRDNAAPLQLRQIYDNTDRWAICDRTGKRWYRAEDGVAAAGWFYEPDRESLCDLGRFTLAEALPLARQLAATPTA